MGRSICVQQRAHSHITSVPCLGITSLPMSRSAPGNLVLRKVLEQLLAASFLCPTTRCCKSLLSGTKPWVSKVTDYVKSAPQLPRALDIHTSFSPAQT